jgi:hypothetical protein
VVGEGAGVAPQQLPVVGHDLGPGVLLRQQRLARHSRQRGCVRLSCDQQRRRQTLLHADAVGQQRGQSAWIALQRHRRRRVAHQLARHLEARVLEALGVWICTE